MAWKKPGEVFHGTEEVGEIVPRHRRSRRDCSTARGINQSFGIALCNQRFGGDQ